MQTCDKFRCGNMQQVGTSRERRYKCRITKGMCKPYVRMLSGQDYDADYCDIIRYTAKRCCYCQFRVGCLYNA